jgi:hypothetical protein
MRDVFDGRLNVEWKRPEDEMPLDAHFKKFPGKHNWGVLDYVFVLINDEEDRNEDPDIVMLEVLVDHEGVFHWCFIGGQPWHDCHIKNIKYWAEIPNYEKVTVERYGNFKSDLQV